MQARLVKAASGSDLARLTAIGNLGVNARPAGFGRQEPPREPTVFSSGRDPFPASSGGLVFRAPEAQIDE